MGHSLGKKFGVAAALLGGVLLIPAALAWACLPVANIQSSPTSAQAGQSVKITGSEFGSNPVQIHFNALDGLVLATFTPDSHGNFAGAVTMPASAQPGPAVLVATEAAATPDGNGGSSPGVPTRTVVQIVGSGGSAPLAVAAAAGQVRPSGVVTSSSGVSAGALALVALGVLGVALLLAGAVALATSGRRRTPAAERVRD